MTAPATGPATGPTPTGARLGVDTGGTFTDAVTGRGAVVKVASTPDDPGRALARAIDDALGGPPDLLAHGTTVATNALLERAVARVGLVTTRGFADLVEIARQDRPALYDPAVERPPPLVDRRDRLEVTERLAPDGTVVVPLDLADAPAVPAGVDALAVVLLHADRDPTHERRVADHYRAQGHDVTCSHEVSPEYREYERLVTTVVNAALRPRCRGYLAGLDAVAREALVMTSAGGLLPAADVAPRPAALLLSGPAAGAVAAGAIAAVCETPDAVAFDMGGTSTDVCLVRDGRPAVSPGREVAGYPVRLPALDIHTIGAGGGSIARIDPGGALVVGPRSAGARPGPACYGHGGTEPTVTDADLLLGRIPAADAIADLGRLDVGAARAVCERTGLDPAGVVAVVDEAMRQAVRAVTVARGVDPRDLALVAYGGAGPLHAVAVAEGLGMRTVVVPPRAGACSAVGLLTSPIQRDLVRSWSGPALAPGGDGSDDPDLAAALGALADEARRTLAGEGARDASVEASLDCRYVGQSHEITVPTMADFPAEHRLRNGYDRPGAPIEVVALRARVTRPAPLAPTDLPDVDRPVLVGPAVGAEADCTVWVPEGWRAEPGPLGAWIVRRHG